MNKIVVNLTHSFHFEDLTSLEQLLKKGGYTNVSIETTPELYQEIAEELAITALLDMSEDELEENLSITTEIL